MRCDQCNKFVSFEEDDPEVFSLEVDENGTVAAEVRIVNSCAECSQELKEATFWFDEQVDIGEHHGEGHELSVNEDSVERTSRSGNFKKGVFVPAFGRYAKTFYGTRLEYSVECSCGKLAESGAFEEDVQASGMDELI